MVLNYGYELMWATLAATKQTKHEWRWLESHPW